MPESDPPLSTNQPIAGKKVLVTGAAGSIGSALCTRLFAHQPASLACLDSNETRLSLLRQQFPQSSQPVAISCHLADITDRESIQEIFAVYRPDVVFHTAADKHVPLMESRIRQAIKNNVFGLLAVADATEQTGVSTLIAVSSDKAVNPASIVGVTKRIGEIILATRPSSATRSISVRFGNVLGSSGSVIPIWTQQLQRGKPLTITDPDAERYFMKPTDATHLLLEAVSVGRHGDILVLEMGDPVRILQLARALIHQSGNSTSQVEMRYIGLRAGEKLREELFYQDELVEATSHPKINRTRFTAGNWEALSARLASLRHAVAFGTDAEIKLSLKAIVPQYSSGLATPIPCSTSA